MIPIRAAAALAILLFTGALQAADISGKWTFHTKFFLGSGDPSFDFHQQGEKLSGTYSGRFGVAPLAGTVKGDQVEFTVTSGQGEGIYKGTLAGGILKGTVKYPRPVGTGHFEGRRNP